MPADPQPSQSPALLRVASSVAGNPNATRVLERVVADARRDGIRLIDAPEELVAHVEWLGVLYLRNGEPARAVPNLRDALKWWLPRFGVDHPRVRELTAYLTDAYQKQGKPVKAIPRLEAKLAAGFPGRIDSSQAEHRRNKLFRAYWAAGRIEEAFGVYQNALTDSEQTHGADSPESCYVRSMLAWEYLDAILPGGLPLLERNLEALQRMGQSGLELAFKRVEASTVYIWHGRAADATRSIDQGLTELGDRDDRMGRMVRRYLQAKYEEVADLQRRQADRPVWAS